MKVPDFEPKDKTAITPAEVLAYLKALAKELEFMTFGEEKTRQSKLISKLHRYLKVNLPTSYGAKCSLETTILANSLRDLSNKIIELKVLSTSM